MLPGGGALLTAREMFAPAGARWNVARGSLPATALCCSSEVASGCIWPAELAGSNFAALPSGLFV